LYPVLGEAVVAQRVRRVEFAAQVPQPVDGPAGAERIGDLPFRLRARWRIEGVLEATILTILTSSLETYQVSRVTGIETPIESVLTAPGPQPSPTVRAVPSWGP
jgi:hypothetical protein